MPKLTKQEALDRLKEKYDELISKGDLAGAAACIAQINTVRVATAYIRESPKPKKETECESITEFLKDYRELCRNHQCYLGSEEVIWVQRSDSPRDIDIAVDTIYR